MKLKLLLIFVFLLINSFIFVSGQPADPDDLPKGWLPENIKEIEGSLGVWADDFSNLIVLSYDQTAQYIISPENGDLKKLEPMHAIPIHAGSIQDGKYKVSLASAQQAFGSLSNGGLLISNIQKLKAFSDGPQSSPLLTAPVVSDQQSAIEQNKIFNNIPNLKTLINEYENLYVDFEGKQIKYQDLKERAANSQISSQALYEEALGYKSIAEMQRDYEGIEIIATTKYKGIGEVCSNDDQCKSDLFCSNNVCTKKKEEPVTTTTPKPVTTTPLKDESSYLITNFIIGSKNPNDIKDLERVATIYGPMIDKIQYDNPELKLIPKNLILSTIWVESNGNPNAVSSAGAAGLMQLMPATAKGLGLSGDERLDPEKSIKAGMYYYKQMLSYSHINNNFYEAIAGYNWGPNRDLLKTKTITSPDELPEPNSEQDARGYTSKIIAGWQYYSSKTSKMGCGYCASSSSKDGVDCSEKECEALSSDCEWDSNNFYQTIMRDKGTCSLKSSVTEKPSAPTEEEPIAVTGGFCFPFATAPGQLGGGNADFGGSRANDPQTCTTQNRCHNGIDIFPKENKPIEVRAIADGYVTMTPDSLLAPGAIQEKAVIPNKRTDIAIKVYHPSLKKTILYGELKRDSTNDQFKENTPIKKGQVLGKTVLQYKNSKTKLGDSTMLHLEMYDGINAAPSMSWWCAPKDVQKCDANTPGKPAGLIDAKPLLLSLNNQNGYQCKSEDLTAISTKGVTGVDFLTYTTKCKDEQDPKEGRIEGMIIPKGLNPNNVVINFYFHGHKTGGISDPNFVTDYVDTKGFLQKMSELKSSGGNEILVILRGSTKHDTCMGNVGDACKWMNNDAFGCYYQEAVSIVQSKGYNPTSFSLSAHSGGGSAILNIINSQSFTAVKSKLKEVIFYDACYGTCSPIILKLSGTNAKIFNYFTKLGGTLTDSTTLCNPSSGIQTNPIQCQNSNVYTEYLTIAHGDVPTKCFLQHIAGGTCTGAEQLVASTGLPGSPGDVGDKRILLIGDSNTAGPFGQSLDKDLRTLSGVTVRTYGVGATEPSNWLRDFIPAKSTVEGGSSIYIDDNNQKNPFSGPSNLKTLIENYKPNVVIISLGTNIIHTVDDTDQKYAPGVLPAIKTNIKKLSEVASSNGVKCYWIGPPKTTNYCKRWEPGKCAGGYYTADQLNTFVPKLNQLIQESAPGCTFINAADLTTSLAPYDGLHYSGLAAQTYAQNVFNDLKAKAL